MVSKKLQKEFKFVDKIQTVGAINDFHENERTAMTEEDVREINEQNFKNIINNRGGK